MRISDWSSDVCSSDLVADRAIQTRAAEFDFRRLRQFEVERHQIAVDALVDLGLAGAHVVTHHERGIAHGERREHMPTQIRAERLAADRLGDEACPVQAIGRAPVCTPVTYAHLVFRLLPSNKKTNSKT